MQKRPEQQRRRAFRVSSACYITNHSTNDFLCRNKDKLNTELPSDEALPSRVDDPELDQYLSSQFTDNESDDDIIEESALDRFNAILQKAQQVAAQAERERRKTCKRPRTYNGKSERTLKRRKQSKDNLKQKGFLSVFDFITFTKKKAHPPESEQARCTAVNGDEIPPNQALEEEEEEEEEEGNDDEDEGDQMFWWMNKVRRVKLLRCAS
jgi:hypothetical protein